MEIIKNIKKIFNIGNFACDLQVTIEKIKDSLTDHSNKIHNLFERDKNIALTLANYNDRLTLCENRIHNLLSQGDALAIDGKRKCPREEVDFDIEYEKCNLHVINMGECSIGFLSDCQFPVDRKITLQIARDGFNEDIDLIIKRAVLADYDTSGHMYFHGAEIEKKRFLSH